MNMENIIKFEDYSVGKCNCGEPKPVGKCNCGEPKPVEKCDRCGKLTTDCECDAPEKTVLNNSIFNNDTTKNNLANTKSFEQFVNELSTSSMKAYSKSDDLAKPEPKKEPKKEEKVKENIKSFKDFI